MSPAFSDNDRTIAVYEDSAALYVERSPARPGPALIALIDEVARLAGPGGTVLELGSGPGNEALRLASLGVNVQATDAAAAFVEVLRARGLAALRLDVRHDDLAGPWDVILANAVLLHLSRHEFAAALVRCRGAVRPGGALVFTVKVGDGDAWSTAKLDSPRHFTYWRAQPLAAVVTSAGWEVVSMTEVAGRVEQWLYVICLRPIGVPD